MRKLLIFLLKSLVLLLLTPFVARLNFAIAERPKTPSWAKTEPSGHEQKTVLQFYFHEIGAQSGKDPSLVSIAEPLEPNISPQPFGFGGLSMADDPLTIGPDLNSTLIGHAQGLYGLASKEEPSLIMGLSYNFIDGIYNGSTISVLGRNRITKPEFREFPVVGGTGLFRMARGYIVAQTISWNMTTGIVVVGYNVTIFHPNDAYSGTLSI